MINYSEGVPPASAWQPSCQGFCRTGPRGKPVGRYNFYFFQKETYSVYFTMLLLWITTTLLLTGCYTFTGTTLPSHLKTIHVEPVINQTLDPVLAEKLTKAIIDGFRSKSSLRAVNKNAHCQLTAILKSYSHDVHNTSGADVTEYRIDISVQVRFHDNVKNETIFEEENLPGFATYAVKKGETEASGQQLAIDNIVEIILDNTISGW
ncbi:LptE family protein [Fibrobacterota bacterium]